MAANAALEAAAPRERKEKQKWRPGDLSVIAAAVETVCRSRGIDLAATAPEELSLKLHRWVADSAGATAAATANADATEGAATNGAQPLSSYDIRGLLLRAGVDNGTAAAAVTAVFSRHKPTQRASANAAPSDSVTVPELVWLLCRYGKPDEPGSAGHTRRRTRLEGAEFDEFVLNSALAQNVRRQFAGDAAGEEGATAYPRSLPDAEVDALLDTLKRPLDMSLRLHVADSNLRLIGVHGLAKPAAAPLQPPPALRGAWQRATVPVLAMADRDYHAAEHLGSQLLCKNLHSAGTWSFQEVVSMLPVAALGIEPHHRVLDLCAAPGSKTLQALDAMRAPGLIAGGGSEAPGVVVANEKDRVKARQTLPARLKRTHCGNTVVMRADGTAMPALVEGDGETAQQVRYDRIICDVPCSGDGTARKDANVWTSWSRAYGDDLAKTQRALLLRAIDMLADGGIVAYSTCSMHDVEDEAVVARALDHWGDEVVLLDANERLRDVGVHLRSNGGLVVQKPPTQRSEEPDEHAWERRAAALASVKDKVLRVLPHRDDTGGFFVALIQRVRPSAQQEVASKLNNWTNAKRFQRVLGTEDEPEFNELLSFFGVTREAFDKRVGLEPLWMLTPTGGKKKMLLASREAARTAFDCRPRKGAGVELVSVGMRAFERLDEKFLPESGCRYRICGEVVSLIGALASEARMVTLESPAAFAQLCTNGHVTTDVQPVPPHLMREGGRVAVGPVIMRIKAPPLPEGSAGHVFPLGQVGEWFYVPGILLGAKIDHLLDPSVMRAAAQYVLGLDVPGPFTSRNAAPPAADAGADDE